MAETGRLTAHRAAPLIAPVTLLRILLLLTLLLVWEGLARSGWLYRDVVPSLLRIGAALYELLSRGDYYFNLGVTAGEIGFALLIGGTSGIVIGLVLGANRFLARAYEPVLYYLGPTPKIIFFPVALSVAAGMRQIDTVLIRVGRSFRAGTLQMVTKIYLPAMRHPIINGVRLGFGFALIGKLLAETQLSNKGIGFLIINAYSTFDMPRMYANLIVLFVLAIGANALIGRFGGLGSIRRT
jgi:ABC-type nitrate/sulfonate/bicarbonate transport system permease component